MEQSIFDIVLFMTHPLIWATRLGRDQMPYSVQVHMQSALKSKTAEDKKKVRIIYADAVGYCIIEILKKDPSALIRWEESTQALINEYKDKKMSIEVILDLSAKAKKMEQDGRAIDRSVMVDQLKVAALERALVSLFQVDKIPGLTVASVVNPE